MTNDERKQIVRQLLTEGRSLSEIQTYLQQEKSDTITYMELRLLLSEIPDVKLPEKERPKPPPVATAIATGSDKGSAPAGDRKLSISVDQIPQPGSMLSGYARFSSGAKGHWFLDEMGRLGLEPELGSDKPNDKDMKEFTTELRRLLQRSGGM
jgi:DNA-binding transcriptional MerR regulator